ncbi:MAG: hypothetical protein ABIV13_03330 [Fimbriimonadales bacterium]
MAETPLEETKRDTALEEPAGTKPSSDLTGTLLGIGAFIAGLVILFVTFRLAYGMFMLPARETLGDEKDVTELGKTFGHVVLRVGLLLVMSVVGSVIAGQGVRLYLASRSKPT